MRSRKIIYRNEQQTQLYDRITKIQTKIIDKLSSLKKNKKHLDCKHLENINPTIQSYNKNIDYYDKYWKTFLINELSHHRIQQNQQYVQQLNKKLNEIETLFNKHESLAGDTFKRKIRRPAEEIERKIQCPYPKCYKSYGSEVSLNLHIKLKHKGGNKTDREKAAELIWQARQKGKPIPQFYINLPPNFVQEYGYMTKRLQKQQSSPHNQNSSSE